MSILKWRELSWTEFGDLDKENRVAVLPIGSLEQHGPALPMATDAACAEKLAEEICSTLDDVKTILLPTIWCSRSNEHIHYPGSVFLSRESFLGIVNDIGASVARAGLKRLAIINWHGGNDGLLSELARDMRQKYDLLVFVINVVKLFDSAAPSWEEEGSYDIHAGRIETSIMMAIHPSLVKKVDLDKLGSDFSHGKMAKAFKGYRHLSPEGGEVMMGWLTNDLTTDGVIGNPAGSNAREGQELFDKWVKIASEIVREISTFDF